MDHAMEGQMTRSIRVNRWLASGCAAVVAVAQGQGVLAQQQGVTTVSPLTSTALAPIPDVGIGASWFAPEDIEVVVHQARNDHIDAKAAVRQCHESGPAQTEESGDFSFEALYDTESKAQETL